MTSGSCTSGFRHVGAGAMICGAAASVKGTAATARARTARNMNYLLSSETLKNESNCQEAEYCRSCSRWRGLSQRGCARSGDLLTFDPDRLEIERSTAQHEQVGARSDTQRSELVLESECTRGCLARYS